MYDLTHAKELLTNGTTCVLVRGERVYTSRESGIRPMVTFLNSGIDLHGFSVADRIVGKAAAMLFLLAGVSEVYGDVMSKTAAELLGKSGIPFEYGVLTDVIQNRKGTGSCPMELAVQDIDNPQEAFAALQKKLEDLFGQKNETYPEKREAKH